MMDARNRIAGPLRIGLVLLVSLALSACSGGSHAGTSPISLLPLAPSGAGSTGSTSASFVIQIPSSRTQTSSRRHIRYVSESTESISIATSGGTPIPPGPTSPNPYIANLTPASLGCVPAAGTTPLTCTLIVPVAATGAVTFTLSLYDSLNATGNLLSTGTVGSTIAPGKANTIKITLNGVVSSLLLTIATPNPPAGTKGKFPITMNALDADGNIIIAPGAYVDANGNPLPITLTDSDTSGATKLSTTSVPGPSTSVSLSYNGSTLLSSATISASAPGIAPVSAVFAPVSSYATLYSFAGGPDGQFPFAGLVDLSGVLYGTTQNGGSNNLGTVYSITPSGTEAVVHSFAGGDGDYPDAGLLNVNGTLYGTAEVAAFSITPSGTLTVLHNFDGGPDGFIAQAGLVYLKGKFYGTTYEGGTNNAGTVFSLTPAGTEAVLHSFGGGTDGTNPYYADLVNVNGTLYGTTYGGGTNGFGSVYSITPSGTEAVVHSFSGGADGANPQAGLVNLDGTLYGTTFQGGANGVGTVYSITPSGTETVLYSFAGGADGVDPAAELVNVNGTFYGTTQFGGANGEGTIFSITPAGAESVLHSFAGGSDGAIPIAGLVNVGGTLFGTTEQGGANGFGTVFYLSI